MVQELPAHTVVILNDTEDQTALARRFRGEWNFLFKNANHQVWSYNNL
jgi:hypothetical protein